MQHGLRGEYNRATADEITKQHAEQERQAAALQHRLGPIAVSDVADFMRSHARNLVCIFSFGDQALEYINLRDRDLKVMQHLVAAQDQLQNPPQAAE